MKKAIYFISALCLMFVACEQEVQTPTAVEEANVQQSNPATAELVQLEKSLAWTAYVAGRVLYDNPTLAAPIVADLDTNESIPLEDLIGSSSTHTVFRTQFLDKMDDFIEGIAINDGTGCSSGKDKNTPPPPPVCGDCTDLWYESLMAYYMDYILIENCVEIYMPVGMDLSEGQDLTTLSHPLTAASHNEGIRRHAIDDVCSTTTNVTVSHAYIALQSNPNILMARPVREFSLTCGYSDIPVTNLRDFLAGPF